MASLSEGKKARQEAMAIELKFHQEKLKQLAIDGGRVLNVEKNEAPRDIEVTFNLWVCLCHLETWFSVCE